MNHIDTILLTICIITAMFSSIAPLIAILIALTFAFRWAVTRYRFYRFEQNNIGDVEHREWLRNLFRDELEEDHK